MAYHTFKSLSGPSFGIFHIKRNKDLLKQVPYVLADQRAAKLCSLKVCTVQDSNPGSWKSSNLVHKLTKNVASDPKGLEIFLTANFDGPYL